MNPRWATFARFLFSGGINTAFGYLSYAALVLTGMPLWLAVAGSTVLAIVFNFYSYGGLVFGQTSRRYMPRFLAFYAALGLANYLLLRVLSHFGMGPLLAQAILVPLLAIAGYVGLRHLVFGQRGSA
jgi:putative flippase GtrA